MKLDYAIKKYNLNRDDLCSGEKYVFTENSKIKCIYNYHLLVKELIEHDEDPIAFTKQLIRQYPDMIIIINEIGSGIIPMDKKNRIWREQAGKAGCIIAEHSESVERIVCGISIELKG